MMPETSVKSVKIERIACLEPVRHEWNTLANDYYQSFEFLHHLERYNKCSQRYYELYIDDCLTAGAIVYTLRVNLFTFSEKSMSVIMHVIGVPASVDSSGFVGDPEYFDLLTDYILASEKGVILCLNYHTTLRNNKIIQLDTLPTVIFKHGFTDFKSYLDQMRHHYRRRAVHALKKFDGINTLVHTCDLFTEGHYKLYLNIMTRSKTKLEVLSIDFFKNLPGNFMLTSYYSKENELLIWHITCEFRNVYSFLFGGIDYEKRDSFDAYYNNLLGIIREGIEKGYKIINLGQTAETSKMRLGGERIYKRMFIFHRNILIRFTLLIFRNFIGYKTKADNLIVFKT